LQAIEKAAARAAALTHQLLAYSRKQMLEPKVLEIDPLIENLQGMLRRLIREDIDLHAELDCPGARVKVDPTQMEQVLINLAVNARDAMHGKGRITVRTERVNPSKLIPAAADLGPGDYLEISVSDTGAGMDAVTVDRIFEPFFTTKDLGKGTGLGLSMVYGIVKQSGGHILVESVPQQGSTYRIYLPVVAASSASERPKDSTLTRLKGEGIILVVEDEPPVRTLISESLVRLGYRTLEACNGEEALMLIHSELDNLDLVITDTVMPKMGGDELCRQLRRLKPEFPVLLISGYSDVLPEATRPVDKRTQFLQKPFVPQALALKVGEMLAERDSALAERAPGS
jgi:CheY-like chemotaxis protein